MKTFWFLRRAKEFPHSLTLKPLLRSQRQSNRRGGIHGTKPKDSCPLPPREPLRFQPRRRCFVAVHNYLRGSHTFNYRPDHHGRGKSGVYRLSAWMEFTVWLLQMLASRMNLWQPPYINVIGKNLCRILWQPTERLELVAQTQPTHQQYSSSRFSFLAFHSTTVLRAANILDMFMEEIVSDTLVWG